jgi:ABC-type branched-subunit amino acid transport system ATPase component
VAWQSVIYGGALLLLVRFRPSGLIPEGAGILPLVRRAVWRVHGPTVSEGEVLEAHAAALGDHDLVISPQVAVNEDGIPPAIIRVEGLSKHFGGITAVDDVTFSLAQGQITALIGPNGAGKTTIFNVITGALKPDAGRVFLRGRNITGWSPTRVAKAGMARSFQDVRTYNRLTALQNVAIAVPSQVGENPLLLIPAAYAAFKSERRTRALALEALGFVGLAAKANEVVGNLSFGDQKLVAIARLLATQSEVLLLDEPTSGVDPGNVENVIEIILGLKKLGRTICLVEHSVHFVERLADWVIFMDQGSVIAEGPIAELTSREELTTIYFGT